MKQAVLFTVAGLFCVGLAVYRPGVVPSPLLAWCGVAVGSVGVAYGVGSPRVFGKRADGTLAWWAIALLLPYLLVQWATWWCWKALSREPAWHEVAPGLCLGRRAIGRELPKEVGVVVDLTDGFPKPWDYAPGIEYVALPTLDGRPPPRAAAMALLARLAEDPRGLYVHCAQGHGRSATLVTLLLVLRNVTPTIDEAVGLVQARRPAVGLSRAQYRFAQGIIQVMTRGPGI
ncbi:MAG: protein-tyrosine phosphatase family protein [Planctomycetota bacterium]